MNAAHIEAMLRGAVLDEAFPGAAYAYGTAETVEHGEVGHLTYSRDTAVTCDNTYWDLASVSKVIGVTTLAMKWVVLGRLNLDQPVSEVIPEFGVRNKEAITMRQLLLHESGLIPFRRYHETISRPSDVIEAILAEPLQYRPGTQSQYSDLSMIVLGLVLEKIAGEKLPALLETEVFSPLGMTSTSFISGHPAAPTSRVEPWRRDIHRMRGVEHEGEYIQGEVHDPTAFLLGGVAGHAGLFSTLGDVTRFAQAMLRGEIVKPEVQAMFTTVASDLSTRALGWDTKDPVNSSAGRKFGRKSYGHTGYTGTSIWIDPDAKIFAVLLSNRVHPSEENGNIVTVRPRFHDAVMEYLVLNPPEVVAPETEPAAN